MSDNRAKWEELNNAERSREQQKNDSEVAHLGYELYTQSDYQRAAEQYHQAAEMAHERTAISDQCTYLDWEGHCHYRLGNLKKSLLLLLQAESIGDGSEAVRFRIKEDLFIVANALPLHISEQKKLLKKLYPYKGPQQIGGSKSSVLRSEYKMLKDSGNWKRALDCAQEALNSKIENSPFYNDKAYYQTLTIAYIGNNRLPDAWRTLREWRRNGSNKFASTKSCQLRCEAMILYTEGQLSAAWDVIRRCQLEEKYANIYGQNIDTLTWLIRIGTDIEQLNEVHSPLLLLFRFRNAESLYVQYKCFYCFAYYYGKLAICLNEGTSCINKIGRCNSSEKAKNRANMWFVRAEQTGRKIDELLETAVRKKELDELREKMEISGA